MDNLINKLKQETQSFKLEYLKMIKEYASKQWQLNFNRREAYFKSKITDYAFKNDYYTEQKWAHNTPYWHFTKEFIERTLKSAVQHYEDSIAKLAFRVKEKELNIENINIKSIHIGVNLDLTISDNNKIVTAQTIIASGPVQKPHYRYLIK